MIEAVFEQPLRLREALVRLRAVVVLQRLAAADDAEEMQRTTLRRGDEAAARRGREAGLDAARLVVVILSDGLTARQIVRRAEHALLGLVRRRHRVGRLGGEFLKLLTLPGPARQRNKVAHGGVVILVMQAVGIGKMRACHAKGRRLRIHERHERRDIPRDVLRHDVAGLVGGRDHHAVQQLAQRQLLALEQAGGAARCIQILQSLMADRHDVVEVSVLQRQHTRHDLRQAGGIDLFVQIHAIDERIAVQLHERRRLGLHRGVEILAEIVQRGRHLIRHGGGCLVVFSRSRGLRRRLCGVSRTRLRGIRLRSISHSLRGGRLRGIGRCVRRLREGREQQALQQQGQQDQPGQKSFFHILLQKRRGGIAAGRNCVI